MHIRYRLGFYNVKLLSNNKRLLFILKRYNKNRVIDNEMSRNPNRINVLYIYTILNI